MQTALRKKTETGNEKDPSAALGMTKRGNASFHSFSTCCGSQPRLAALGSPFQRKVLAWSVPPSYGRRCPEGAEGGWGKRYEKRSGKIVSSTPFARVPYPPLTRSPFPNGEGYDTRIPLFSTQRLPQWGRLRNENAAIPDTKPSQRETGRGIHFSFTNFHLSMI